MFFSRAARQTSLDHARAGSQLPPGTPPQERRFQTHNQDRLIGAGAESTGANGARNQVNSFGRPQQQRQQISVLRSLTNDYELQYEHLRKVRNEPQGEPIKSAGRDEEEEEKKEKKVRRNSDMTSNLTTGGQLNSRLVRSYLRQQDGSSSSSAAVLATPQCEQSSRDQGSIGNKMMRAQHEEQEKQRLAGEGGGAGEQQHLAARYKCRDLSYADDGIR